MSEPGVSKKKSAASTKNSAKTTKSFPKIQIFTSPGNEEEKEEEAVTQTKTRKATKSVGRPKKKPLADKNIAEATTKNTAEATKAPEKEIKAPVKKQRTKPNDAKLVDKENVSTVPQNIKPNNEEKSKKRPKSVPPNPKTNKSVPKARSTREVGDADVPVNLPHQSKPAGPKTAQKKRLDVADSEPPATMEPIEKKNSRQTLSPNRISKNFQTDRDVAILKSTFPNIDPAFLKAQYVKMKRSVEDTINLISGKKDGNPSAQVNKPDIDKIQIKYTTGFKVEEYLKTIPDPWNYFLNTELHNCIRYADLSLDYLKKKFTKHYVHTIRQALMSCEYSLYRTFKDLSSKGKSHLFKKKLSSRGKTDSSATEPTRIDFQFLQEVAFLEHEDEIIEFLRKLEADKFKKFKNVLTCGGLLRCQKCSNSNLVWENVTYCGDNHVICRDCINEHVMIEISAGNFNFPCPLYCQKFLSFNLIQDMLRPELTAIIVRKNQLDELISAGIEDVEYCPNCYYTKFMPPPEQNLFYCLNPTCLKVSCRQCKRDGHEPFPCSQLKHEEIFEIKSEPISIPICSHCDKEYIKKENSNKMTCSCGSIMCYTCRQPFLDCAHSKLISRHQNNGESSDGDNREDDYACDDDEAYDDCDSGETDFADGDMTSPVLESLPKSKSLFDPPEIITDFQLSDSDAF